MNTCILVVFALIACVYATAPTSVFIDNYTGSDDDRLTAAIAEVKKYNPIPPITLTNRKYTFTITRTPFNGLKMIGPPVGYLNSDIEGGRYNSVQVVLKNLGTGVNSWMYSTTKVSDVHFANIGFTATGTSQFWHQPVSTEPLTSSQFTTLGFFGFEYVFGTPSAPCYINNVTYDGQWTDNAVYGTQFTLSGTSSTLWVKGYLNIGGNPGVAGGGKYLMIFSSLTATHVGPIYVTANNKWAGIYISGATANTLTFTGCRFEGLNAKNPSSGAVVVQAGATVTFMNIWMAYGMAAPSDNGHSPVDAGMIMHTGGAGYWFAVTYDRALTVAQTVPLAHVSGGTFTITNVFAATSSTSWSILPIVAKLGSPSVTCNDGTAQLVPVTSEGAPNITSLSSAAYEPSSSAASSEELPIVDSNSYGDIDTPNYTPTNSTSASSDGEPTIAPTSSDMEASNSAATTTGDSSAAAATTGDVATPAPTAMPSTPPVATTGTTAALNDNLVNSAFVCAPVALVAVSMTLLALL